jgi:hypothetical protein
MVRKQRYGLHDFEVCMILKKELLLANYWRGGGELQPPGLVKGRT